MYMRFNFHFSRKNFSLTRHPKYFLTVPDIRSVKGDSTEFQFPMTSRWGHKCIHQGENEKKIDYLKENDETLKNAALTVISARHSHSTDCGVYQELNTIIR
ncbi:Uncharacterised protein [Morganella morganii]|nr:Uncharacterised protein [Morganella morganii]